MKINLKLVFNALVVLCFVFGILNLVFGFFMLYNYFTIQTQISTNLLYLNQSLQSSQALLNNATSFTHITSSAITSSSSNIAIQLESLDKNISSISNSFRNEGDYFNSLTIPGGYTQQIAGTFESIASQLNYTQQKEIPRVVVLINNDSTQIDAPLNKINSSVSALGESITLTLQNAVGQINAAEQTILLLVLGFAIYLIIEGAFFILFGLLLYYS